MTEVQRRLCKQQKVFIKLNIWTDVIKIVLQIRTDRQRLITHSCMSHQWRLSRCYLSLLIIKALSFLPPLLVRADRFHFAIIQMRWLNYIYISGSREEYKPNLAYITINRPYKYECCRLQDSPSPAWLNVVRNPQEAGKASFKAPLTIETFKEPVRLCLAFRWNASLTFSIAFRWCLGIWQNTATVNVSNKQIEEYGTEQ